MHRKHKFTSKLLKQWTVYMFGCLWCAPCIYSLFNGMEWFGSDVVGKLMRCVAQFVMIIRFMLCSHTFESHHIYFILHKKKQQKQQKKNQPNNNNNNRDKKNSGNRIDFTWFIVAHVTESKLCVLCSCDAHAWNCDENLSFSYSLWFLLNNLQQKMEK